MSRAKRLQAELEKIEAAANEAPRNALCQRLVPPTARQSEHHLVLKLRGGTFGPTVRSTGLPLRNSRTALLLSAYPTSRR
ncbi:MULTISPECIES: hypothetical protein [Methylopilaceae]|uniref:Uncharacterized protein n=1 Tax=Hansschlegelia zhihuaiae TaxID=405005 RepID=A0A4Q0MAF0_9HYPH|nr:hypothetical protein [Hansschlegelia zhihuaiae]RXF69973.1 hypothetical protein EK403_17770 [Hansschlegelia zhihuaiae]